MGLDHSSRLHRENEEDEVNQQKGKCGPEMGRSPEIWHLEWHPVVSGMRSSNRCYLELKANLRYNLSILYKGIKTRSQGWPLTNKEVMHNTSRHSNRWKIGPYMFRIRTEILLTPEMSAQLIAQVRVSSYLPASSLTESMPNTNI